MNAKKVCKLEFHSAHILIAQCIYPFLVFVEEPHPIKQFN
jgi:hypothetical protein